jgi:hypothetical protein
MNDESRHLGGIGMARRFIVACDFRRAAARSFAAPIELVQARGADRLRDPKASGAAEPTLSAIAYRAPRQSYRIGLSAVKAQPHTLIGHVHIGEHA